MTKTTILISFFLVLSGCAIKTTSDLTGYTLEGFQNEPAVCDSISQCKYIGYGIGNGGCTSSPIFKGFIIYSTKMGESNIEHLKRLADESRILGHRRYPEGTMFASVEGVDFEVCLPIGNKRLNLQCVEHTCKDIGYKEE